MRNTIIYFLIANFLLLLSNLPLLMYVTNPKGDTVFQGIHIEWEHDYYSYLAFITEGKEGQWLRTSAFSVEPTKPNIFYIYYIYAGKIAKLLNLDPATTYHLVRLASAEFLIISVYLLSAVILGKKLALWGGLFALLGTVSPPIFFPTKIQTDYYPFGNPFWISFDSLNRLYALAHHIFGQAVLTLGYFLFIRYITSRNLKYAFLSALISFIGIILFPPILLPLILSVTLSYLVYTIIHLHQSGRITVKYKDFLSVVFFLILIGLSALILKYEENADGLRSEILRLWDVGRWNVMEPYFDPSFMIIFGILPILALPSIIYGFLKNRLPLIFLSFWAMTPFILLPFMNLLVLSKLRLLQINPYIPMGILSAYTVFILPVLLKKYLLKKILFVLFFLSTIPVIIWMLILRYQSMHYYISRYTLPIIYLPKSTYQSMQYINANIPKNSNFLSSVSTGLLIPAYSLNRSFIGHMIDTMNYSGKEKEMTKFFSLGYSNDEASSFLNKYNISYVYYGPNEKLMDKPLSYPFLKEIYSFEDIRIYQVIR